MKILTRRGFLVAGLSTTAAATLLLPWGKTAAASPASRTGAATLGHWAKALGAGPHTAELGRCCIAQGAAELDSRIVVARLNEALAAQSLHPADNSPDALRAAMRSLRRHEFLAGEVVRVDGWVLCRSEARGYALGAIAAAQA